MHTFDLDAKRNPQSNEVGIVFTLQRKRLLRVLSKIIVFLSSSLRTQNPD